MYIYIYLHINIFIHIYKYIYTYDHRYVTLCDHQWQVPSYRLPKCNLTCYSNDATAWYRITAHSRDTGWNAASKA